MSAPKVGVVVVNYRTPDLALACAESLRTLDYSNWKLLVVDNASGDDSATKFAAGLAPDEWLLSATNGGYTAGNNRGVSEMLRRGCDYVMVLNPDTVVANPAFLSELVRHLEDNPKVGAVGPRVFLRSHGNVQNTVLKFPWIWRRTFDWFKCRFSGSPLRSKDVVVDAEVLNGVCVLFRCDALKDVGLFDERTFAYIEDVDWAFRADRKGWKRSYLPIDSVVHLQKENGYERGGNVDFLLKRNTLYFLMKSRRWLQAAGYTAATMTLAAIHSIRNRSPNWSKRLGSAYFRLWTARWNSTMGRPR
jgi:N-acetylglucosaminyl-diphospho-decaprenol L-rhamnosyltransferase